MQTKSCNCFPALKPWQHLSIRLSCCHNQQSNSWVANLSCDHFNLYVWLKVKLLQQCLFCLTLPVPRTCHNNTLLFYLLLFVLFMWPIYQRTQCSIMSFSCGWSHAKISALITSNNNNNNNFILFLPQRKYT